MHEAELPACLHCIYIDVHILLMMLQELAALSKVNPAQLAAQASTNSRLAREAAAASAPKDGSPAAAISPELLQSLAKTRGAGYGASIPPGLDLAGRASAEQEHSLF